MSEMLCFRRKHGIHHALVCSFDYLLVFLSRKSEYYWETSIHFSSFHSWMSIVNYDPKEPLSMSILWQLIGSSKFKEVHWAGNQKASGLCCNSCIYQLMRSSWQPSTHMELQSHIFTFLLFPHLYNFILWPRCLLLVWYLIFSLQKLVN